MILQHTGMIEVIVEACNECPFFRYLAGGYGGYCWLYAEINKVTPIHSCLYTEVNGTVIMEMFTENGGVWNKCPLKGTVKFSTAFKKEVKK